MKDSTLFKIALITSLTGILILLFILERVEVPLVEINKITKESIDKDVKIKGHITSIKETPGLYIIKIKDQTGTISVVLFKEDELILKENYFVLIEGKVQEYKNILEIQGKKIILLKNNNVI